MFFICIDFDGTIVEHKFPYIGQPVPLAIEYMDKFISYSNVKMILYTMRSDQLSGNFLTSAVDYLNNNGIYDFWVNENQGQKVWSSSPKVFGNVYIDDCAIGTPMIKPEGFDSLVVDWSIIGPMVIEKIESNV